MSTDPLVKALERCERLCSDSAELLAVIRQALTTYKPGLTAICPRCSAYIVGEGTGPSSDQSAREECARIAEQEAARLRDKQERVAEYDCDTRLALHIMEQRALTADAIAAAIRAADTAGKEIHSSDGGVEGHAAGRPESASNSVEQADAVNAPNIRPAGIKPGPSEASPPAVKGLVEQLRKEADNAQFNEDLDTVDDCIDLMREAADALSRISAPGGEG